MLNNFPGCDMYTVCLFGESNFAYEKASTRTDNLNIYMLDNCKDEQIVIDSFVVLYVYIYIYSVRLKGEMKHKWLVSRTAHLVAAYLPTYLPVYLSRMQSL